MNILLLSNGAPNYHFFFNSLAKLFHADGANIAIAVDSHFSRVKNELDALGFEIYEFSSYFAKHKINPEILKKYAEFNLNAALLSDFERAQVYRIWGRKEDDYFDRLKSALLSYYEEIFLRHGIDVVLYENVSNTFAHFAFFVAEKLGARYCGIGGSRLPGRFSISSNPLQDNEVEKIFHDIQAGNIRVPAEVKEWCEQYLDNIETIVPDYMKINGLDNTSLSRRYLQLSRLKTIFSLFRHLSDDAYHAFQIGNPLRTYANLFKRNVSRRLKLEALNNYYDKPTPGEPFLLYLLHFHPESSTSILAGAYLDEYEVIRNIAFNLPEGVKLYVKDHISAWGYPSLDFYKKLKSLPNIKILHPGEQTKQLIKKSLAIITLTSTVGYEALLLGKEVFLFGQVFYQFHENVIKIDNPSQIFELLKKHNKNPSGVNRNYNLNFLAAYYLSTTPGSLNMMLAGSAAKAMAEMIYPSIRKDFQRSTEHGFFIS